jgi:hypothetical protein
MKKSLLALSLTALLFSCKKETTNPEFTATDMTGTGWLSGYASKTVITPNGTGGWTNTSRVPAQGVNVTVRVAKNQLYPASNAAGADVYSGTTDANGYYKIAIKSNASGVVGNVVIDGFYATQDTVINGVKKAGLWNTWTGLSTTRNIFIGQTTNLDHTFNATNPTSNPNNINIGSAIVTGSVSMNFAMTTKTGTNPAVPGTTNVPVPSGTKVYLDFTMDPTILAVKKYETTTDAAGSYTFNLATVAAGTTGFPQNATIWIADYARSRDTIKIVVGTATTTVPGLNGVFNNTSTTQNGVFNSEIRNAVNLNYGAFTPN